MMGATWRVVTGDARETLATLPAASVQCCVTSPPYFGLRDYGTAQWLGGDLACDHRAPDEAGATDKPTIGQREHAGRFAGPSCWQCGALRRDQQLGLEATPAAYVAALVGVCGELWRVLRDDGTVWLNLGDSYNSGGDLTRNDVKAAKGLRDLPRLYRQSTADVKPKDLIGIPWRVAFALQAAGWYLRSDIIWAKPNPMPESVTDRPTRAHEYLFLLTKRERYYYDAAAIAEAGAELDRVRNDEAFGGKNGASVRHGAQSVVSGAITTRNKRSVWHVATHPYSEAHFATFPEALIEPCILAGSRPGDLVLDPFCGSGTTGAVAIAHDRAFVGIELNPSYCELARRRIGAVAPLFAREVAPAVEAAVAGLPFEAAG